MKVDAMKRGDEFGIFSFFIGAGFLDLCFEDAGFAAEAVGVSDCQDKRNRK